MEENEEDQAASDCDEGKVIHNPHDAIGVTDEGISIVNGAKTIFIQPANWRKKRYGNNVCEMENPNPMIIIIIFSVLKFMCPYERLNFRVFWKA